MRAALSIQGKAFSKGWRWTLRASSWTTAGPTTTRASLAARDTFRRSGIINREEQSELINVLMPFILSFQVYDNDDVTHAEAIKFTESQTWAAMIEGVRLRTGVEVTSLSIFPFNLA